jgi:hypothetical protein
MLPGYFLCYHAVVLLFHCVPVAVLFALIALALVSGCQVIVLRGVPGCVARPL